MANIKYRASSTPTIPGTTSVKGSALTNLEMDGNLKSIDNDIQSRVTTNNPTFTGFIETPNEFFEVGANDYPPFKPSLNLDFSKSDSLDPRIQFTRTSTATRVNPAGFIEEVAANMPRLNYDSLTKQSRGLLIEPNSTNSLAYTEQFQNAYWGKSDVVIGKSAILAPDGNKTAEYVVATNTGTSVERYFEYNLTGVTAAANTVSSIFVKQGIASHVKLSVYGIGDANHYVYLTFTTGVATTGFSAGYTSGGGTTTGFGAKNYGNGWWRIWIAGTPDSTATNRRFRVWAYNNAESANYAGDGVIPAVHVWGAQMEITAQSGSPSAYMPSTVNFTARAGTANTVNSSGILTQTAAGVLRLTYNPSILQAKPKPLVEGSGTNLLTYSKNLSTNWTGPNIVLNISATTGPDDVSNSACSITENTAATVEHYIEQNLTSLTLSNTYTRSIWVKSNGRNIRFFTYSNPTFGVSASFDFDPLTGVVSGQVINGGAVQSIQTEFYPTGWWRVIQTFRLGGADTSILYRMTLLEGSNNFYTGDGTRGAYFYGAQLETGVSATTYMDSTATNGTRVADTYTTTAGSRSTEIAQLTGTNFTSWYRQGEGTIYVEHEYHGYGGSAYPGVFSMDDLGLADRSIGLIYDDAAGNDPLKTEFFTGASRGYGPGLLLSTAIDQQHRTAIGYKNADFAAVSTNGAMVTDTTAGLVPVVNRLNIGALRGQQTKLFGHIKVFRYYPVKFTNTQIQRLVTQ